MMVSQILLHRVSRSKTLPLVESLQYYPPLVWFTYHSISLISYALWTIEISFVGGLVYGK